VIAAVVLAAVVVAAPPHSALAAKCPAGVTVTVGQVPAGKSGLFSTDRPCTVRVRPGLTVAKRARVLAHELEHARRFAARPGDVEYWSMGEPVVWS